MIVTVESKQQFEEFGSSRGMNKFKGQDMKVQI